MHQSNFNTDTINMETLSVRPLSIDLAAKATEELNENPKKIYDDLVALRSWLSKQPHINARKDDQFLIAFLRGCKYSLERAKEKIDMYYTVRTAIPEIFQSRDLTPQLQEILELGLAIPLHTVDNKTGARVTLVKPVAYDPRKFNFIDVMKVSCMVSDMQLWDDDTLVVCGQVLVIDVQGISFGHIGQLTPSLIRKLTSFMQEAYPIRQKGIHFINALPIIDAAFKIFYNFLSSKIKKRIFVHDSLEALHKHISKELLPTEYGGSAGSVQSLAADLKDKMLQRREWFIEDENYKTDESKRPGKPKTAEALFGTVGSFRTLDFD